MTEEVWFSLRLSLQVALVATFFIVIVGVAAGYLLARKKFLGRDLLDILFTLPLVLPPTVTGYYLIILFGRNGWLGRILYAWSGWSIMFTWYAAVLASFVVALPLMVRTTRAAIESVDRNLIFASHTLDEPFSALDNPLRLELHQYLTGAARKYKIPVILVTHDLNEALKLGDKIIIYSQGRVIQAGAPAEIRDNPVIRESQRFYDQAARDFGNTL
jgi:hypothetical protein